MYERKTATDIRCPLEYGIKMFGGKWKSRVLCILSSSKSLRFHEIREEMQNITDAVLATTLKELVADQLILRITYDEIPPHVEYKLTKKGESIIPILQSICSWSGIFYQEDPDHTMTQCQTCDHRN